MNPFFPEATLTPDIYWASQPPVVRALRALDSSEAPLAAKQLSDQGYKIDVAIIAYQFDPVTTMGIRQNSGFTWVPAGNQAQIPTMPNCPMPGLPNYDPNNPPVGSIKVSIDAADYPAFDPPPPPPPALPTNIVGAREFANVYTYGPGAWSTAAGPKTFAVADGQQVTQDGVTYTAHLVNNLVGQTLNFTRNA